MLARRIWLMCLQCSISLSCQYVGKDLIIQKGADALSRWQDDMDCQLLPGLFDQLWQLCGPFDVDRFATSSNAQRHPDTGHPLPFCSRFLEPSSMGMDALAADWRGCTNYAFPPPTIMDRVVSLIQRQQARTLLVAPEWPSAIWWPILLGMSPRKVVLPHGTAPFQPHRSGCHHPFGWGFHAPDKAQFAAFLFTFPPSQVCWLVWTRRFCCHA